MAKLIQFTKEMLSNQPITILRELGRAIGVKAPASKKKAILVNEILLIQSGELVPSERSNRGAPSKHLINITEFWAKDESEYFDKEHENTKGKFNDVVQTNEEGNVVAEGVLEYNNLKYGFIRLDNNIDGKNGIFVCKENVIKYNLKDGDRVKAVAFYKRGQTDAPPLVDVLEINGLKREEYLNVVDFERLTPCYPEEQIKLSKSGDMALRLIDLFAPVGLGQRGLIVAPPKTGKTTLLKKIAEAIENYYPEIKLMVLLIDERPEEVTDFKRSIKSSVIYSTFDQSALHHVKISESVITRAKRLVEAGQNVVILMDSITRLARAYNTTIESSGKVLSGGLDPMAMQGPKRFFGSARNIENGGSLTILSTALIETGSRMDDIVFEEFKGTGNMEIYLSKELYERRIFPAIDLYKSGTRKEELLLSDDQLDLAFKLRKILNKDERAVEIVSDAMNKTKDNGELAQKIDTWMKFYNK